MTATLRRALIRASPLRRGPGGLLAPVGPGFRLKVRDQPGAFAGIARRMADAGISLDSIVQRNRPIGTAPRPA